MATKTTSDARLNFRLPAHLKDTIEQAAAQQGQTVSDFAVSTLARTAKKIVRAAQVTELSNRDRDIFLALLDSDAKPNKALIAAARRYNKHFGRS